MHYALKVHNANESIPTVHSAMHGAVWLYDDVHLGRHRPTFVGQAQTLAAITWTEGNFCCS